MYVIAILHSIDSSSSCIHSPGGRINLGHSKPNRRILMLDTKHIIWYRVGECARLTLKSSSFSDKRRSPSTPSDIIFDGSSPCAAIHRPTSSAENSLISFNMVYRTTFNASSIWMRARFVIGYYQFYESRRKLRYLGLSNPVHFKRFLARTFLQSCGK